MKERARKRILFVCLGNICRSPAAECVMREHARRKGCESEIAVDSAGMMDWHTGKGPDERMRAAGMRRGIAIGGSARQVTAADLESFDLVLAMDDENLAGLMKLAELNPGASSEINLFCEFCTRHDDRIVPDPYYGGEAGFDHVLDLLEDGCANLVNELRTTMAGE